MPRTDRSAPGCTGRPLANACGQFYAHKVCRSSWHGHGFRQLLKRDRWMLTFLIDSASHSSFRGFIRIKPRFTEEEHRAPVCSLDAANHSILSLSSLATIFMRIKLSVGRALRDRPYDAHAFANAPHRKWHGPNVCHPFDLYAHKPWPNGQQRIRFDENHATAVESQLNPGKIQNN